MACIFASIRPGSNNRFSSDGLERSDTFTIAKSRNSIINFGSGITPSFPTGFRNRSEKYCPWDGTFSKYNEAAPWLEEIPSYVRRNGCSRFKVSMGKWGKGSGRPQHKTRRSSQSVLTDYRMFHAANMRWRRMFVCRDEKQQPWHFKVGSSLPVQRTETDLYYAPTGREMVCRFLVRVARNSAVNQGPRKAKRKCLDWIAA